MATSVEDLVPARQRDFGAGSLIVCDRLVRIYIAAGIEVQALQGLDLLVNEGEIVALVGASGSGKSTLMNILAGLDTPTAGSVRVAGQDLAALSKRQRLAYRRRAVGFVWQQTSRNLLPYLTAQQNVELPMRLADGGIGRQAAGRPGSGYGSGRGAGRRRKRATELLDLLGLGDCLHRRPDQLSGGEQQRTAIAVALVNEPKVLLADEPTGELDTATAAEVFGALQQANSELGVTVLIVTHDPAVSAVVRRTVAIRDGRTSTEIHRHAIAGDDGEVAQHAVEYAVLDRAGRLQLPREMTEPLGMRDLVRLESEPDHIGVWPDRRAAGSGEDQ
jgi:ABC-type lipoprotein export system ATPase subunit